MKKPAINYPNMLLKNHRITFHKHLENLNLRRSDRIYCKQVYDELINIKNIQMVAAHSINTFWSKFITGTVPELFTYTSNNTFINPEKQTI